MRHVEDPLTQGRRHVAEAEQRVARQRELVAHLRRKGQDAAQAEELLLTYEIILQSMRDHLEQELASAAAPTGRN